MSSTRPKRATRSDSAKAPQAKAPPAKRARSAALESAEAVAPKKNDFVAVSFVGQVTATRHKEVCVRPLHRADGGALWLPESALEAKKGASLAVERHERVSREAIAKLLLGAGDAIFEVVFYKKPSHENILPVLEEVYDAEDLDLADLKTVAVDLAAGEERTLVGRLAGGEQKELMFGRVLVRDVEAEAESRKPEFRLVDLRTVMTLILRGVEYTRV